MKVPQFKNALEYEKAQILMQPSFIRMLDNIRKESEFLNWLVNYEEIQEPFPGYIVCLKHNQNSHPIKKNVWELCFQVCFDNYDQSANEQVITDKSLFNDEGELDWQQLELKTQKLVKNLFVDEV